MSSFPAVQLNCEKDDNTYRDSEKGFTCCVYAKTKLQKKKKFFSFVWSERGGGEVVKIIGTFCRNANMMSHRKRLILITLYPTFFS